MYTSGKTACLLYIWCTSTSVPRKKAIEETKVAEAEGHDETETKQDANRNTLRSVVVTRMMTEGAVSAVKVPVLLALASMYFQGKCQGLHIWRYFMLIEF